MGFAYKTVFSVPTLSAQLLQLFGTLFLTHSIHLVHSTLSDGTSKHVFTTQLLTSLSGMLQCLCFTYVTVSKKVTHTQPFYGPSGFCPGLPGWADTRKVPPGRWNQSGFTGARDSEWQWHQLGHMQICILTQTDNHASIPPLSCYRPDVTVGHWEQQMRREYKPLKCEDYARYCVCRGLRSIRMIGYWIKPKCRGTFWNLWRQGS